MVFKLVQIDSEHPNKITLESGTHIFGRGKFLNVNDKRISRQHGQFKVTDDSLIITALHQNPCFYQKIGATQAQMLSKNSSITLNSGDKIGLLPNSYWYEVLQCVLTNAQEIEETLKECHETASHEITVDSDEETDSEKEIRSTPIVCPNIHVATEKDNLESQSTQVLLSYELEKEPNLKEIESSNCDSKSIVDSDKTHVVDPCSPSLLSAAQDTEELPSEKVPSSSDHSIALLKRTYGSKDDDDKIDEVKKIKTEPEDQSNVKLELESSQAGSSNSDANNKPSPTTAAPAPLRERCMYGASCYRRNPVHRAQFSHPQDVDWGPGAKAPCPWGAACAKRDPRHWRDHDHPPGKEQPPPQPDIRVVHRQGNVFYINARTVHFYDDHLEAEHSDGNSVDYDYEF